MRLVRRKSETERLLDRLGTSVGAAGAAVNRRTLVKGGLVAGGLAALTAGSAAVSSLRRRLRET